MIERGRHLNIDKELRFCPFCPNYVEDETHFLINCTTYSSLRKELMNKIQNNYNRVGFAEMREERLFIYLMTNNNIAPLVAKYLTKMLELREFLTHMYKVYA